MNKLTLTGASLVSGQQKHNIHSHSHQNKACCHNNSCEQELPIRNANKGAFERLLSESNREARTVALHTAVKVGPFEGFKRLCDAIQQKEKNDTMDASKTEQNGSALDIEEKKSELLLFDNDGYTLAHWAAKRNDVRFIEYMSNIPGGIELLNLPSKDSVGMHPLHWAATIGSIPVSAFLLKKLCTNSSNPHVYPISSLISENGHKGQDPNYYDTINVRDKSRNTPLIVAAQYGHADLCAFLVKRGADVNAVDEANDTAMHWAAYKGVAPVMGLFCHIGKNSENDCIPLDLADKFGQTPLHLASLRGNAEVVQYLLEEAENREKASFKTTFIGRDKRVRIQHNVRKLLMIKDKNGLTPLELAKKKQQKGCEIILTEWLEERLVTPNNVTGLNFNVLKKMCSLKTCKIWFGLEAMGTSHKDSALMQQNTRWPFFITSGTLFFFPFYLPLKFTPIFHTDQGLMWDMMSLHTASFMSLFLCILFFYLTWTTNPGILSTNPSNPNSKLDGELEKFTRQLQSQYDQTLESYTSQSDQSSTENQPVQLCHSCHIVKPLRSKHCRVLRKCVLVYDHYCPFVGNAIGLYNYGYFYIFLHFCVLTQLFFIITSFIYLKRAPTIDIPVLLGCIYMTITLVPGVSLLGYHTQLTTRELTTNEHQNYSRYNYLRDDRNKYFNPWNKGYLRNFFNRVFPSHSQFLLPLSTPRGARISIGSDDVSNNAINSSEEERSKLLSSHENV